MDKWIEKKTGMPWPMVALVLIGVSLFAVQVAIAASGTFTQNKHWKQKWERIDAVAGETISPGDPVALNRYTGKAYKADSDDADRRPAVGLAGVTATAGNRVEIVRKGILSGLPCGLTAQYTSAVTPVGAPLFLDNSQGGITTFTGVGVTLGVSQILATVLPLSEQATANGVTIGSDTILVDVQPPIYNTGTTIGAKGYY